MTLAHGALSDKWLDGTRREFSSYCNPYLGIGASYMTPAHCWDHTDPDTRIGFVCEKEIRERKILNFNKL